MAVDSLCDLFPILGPERPKHQVRAVASGKSGQPIYPPMLTNPISRLNVVWVRILREPRSLSLLCCEKTLLVFRNLVEPRGGFSALSHHITILQLI